jgi:hypothetical protein
MATDHHHNSQAGSTQAQLFFLLQCSAACQIVGVYFKLGKLNTALCSLYLNVGTVCFISIHTQSYSEAI